MPFWYNGRVSTDQGKYRQSAFAMVAEYTSLASPGLSRWLASCGQDVSGWGPSDKQQDGGRFKPHDYREPRCTALPHIWISNEAACDTQLHGNASSGGGKRAKWNLCSMLDRADQRYNLAG